ncbi:MAG TPA: metalloregulator ArsR/SmtB family transcription factor [Terracidiphilus sp.]|nr:metalloregulator ArsR/SmtB family transcription factor [Terracidiphilus sp.]
MTHKLKKKLTSKPKARARVFAALGDRTRVALVAQLAVRPGSSIAQLGEGIEMTRQAVTKHLEVLERAGVVRSRLSGRERLFELELEALEGARGFLEVVVAQRVK